MSASRTPQPGSTRGNGARTGKIQARGTTRSGLGDIKGEWVEVWSDEDQARATGLLQILGEDGRADPARVPKLAPAELVRMYRGMLMSRTLDARLLPMQRQGRIGFYIGAPGQEAGIIGGAHALSPQDYFVPGLRETSAGLYRGMPLATHMAQLFGNADDLAHGRQLPCHAGTRASRHVVMSSCVSSQIPHATGIAWAAKLRKDPIVALGYLGDGGTSEEDFHTGLNFAAVYKVPAVFVCQNNQWAISTPLALQTVSETIAVKGLAYGVPSIRVDGNDIFAMYTAAKEAVDRARAGGGPSFIESLTYRIGPHSSSDDPTRYRDDAEPEIWRRKDPLVRYKKWLLDNNVLSAADETQLAADLDREIRAAMASAEAVGPPAIETLITDVYADVPWHLREQLAELERVRGKRQPK